MMHRSQEGGDHGTLKAPIPVALPPQGRCGLRQSPISMHYSQITTPSAAVQ